MPLLKDDYKKEEKINGVIYNMSPSAGYQHGIVNSNIHTIVKQGLRGTLCLTFMENLDYRYHQGSDDYVIPDVMIICDRKYLKGSAYTGTPKFIVETLSPATALRDKTIKKDIILIAIALLIILYFLLILVFTTSSIPLIFSDIYISEPMILTVNGNNVAKTG